MKKTLAASLASAALMVLGLGLAPAVSVAKSQSHSRGALVQLPGRKGCLINQSDSRTGCTVVRALEEPGPFMGSRAIALSPNGKHVYVASSKSDAITIFVRNSKRGTLKQSSGKAGCIAARTIKGCALAVTLDGPNSIAVSPDGGFVYATSRNSSSLTTFRRNRKSGALSQLPGPAGCISSLGLPNCQLGRAMSGVDVVTISPDGKNVYTGAFFGAAVATFNRDASTGILSQPADNTGCLTGAVVDGCDTGLALSSPEGMEISKDGKNVYVATATSNAVLNLVRDPDTGALSQATDGSGCIVAAALTGCTTGSQISGANAIAISPDDNDLYVTSLISSSVTGFNRNSPQSITQPSGKSACVEWLGATGCALGRALRAPEGIAVSPDGANIYAAAYSSGGIAVMDRRRTYGDFFQKKGSDGCVTTQSIAKCASGRYLSGVSSIVVSGDGRFVYSTSAKSNAINVFRRVTGRG